MVNKRVTYIVSALERLPTTLWQSRLAAFASWLDCCNYMSYVGKQGCDVCSVANSQSNIGVCNAAAG